MVFGDEHHRKTKLGRATKYECRIRRDGAGNVAPKERGGELPKKNRMMAMKFHKEARGLFLVAEVKVAAAAADDDDDDDSSDGEGRRRRGRGRGWRGMPTMVGGWRR